MIFPAFYRVARWVILDADQKDRSRENVKAH